MWLILLIFLLTLLWYIFRRQYSYWSKQGVPGPDPIPIFGNVGKSIIGVKPVGEIITDIYRKYEDYPFVGIYRGGTPCLIIRDVDFIKNIMVKDFRSFQDNGLYVDKEIDPLVGRHPFVARGEEWKKLRSQLTNCFSSGKMKNVFPLIEEVARHLVQYIENRNKSTNSTGIDTKELCARFTLGNVTSCAFGIDGKAFEDPESEFSVLARTYMSSDSWAAFNLVLLTIIPKLSNFISLKVVPKDVEERLLSLVRDNIKYREENNIDRNDIFQLLTQIVKSSGDLRITDVAGHASTFLVDGYDTSAQAMNFLLFELAMSPDVQSKLREEINNSLEKNNNQFSYESIQEMAYLDACFKEVVRRYPLLLFLAKTCTERYTYTPTNPDYKDISVTVEPGTPIFISLEGLHMDTKYFESPEKFLPERFLDKQNDTRYVFMPFGEGPRACVGQRFGTMQVKIGIAYLIKNFRITINERTPLPLKIDPWKFILTTKGGMWLNFYKI